jgi:3-phenylpropionate/cinnamic acid dioxygenase small subunit
MSTEAQALRDILDRDAVTSVCVRYATALDTRDWELLRSCFTPDAKGDYGGIGALDGYEDFERVCRRALEPLAASQHLLGNFAVRVAGDEASATCYFQAQHVKPGTAGGDTYIVAGTYSDRHVRTADGWRIAHRTLTVTWTDGNPAVLVT